MIVLSTITEDDDEIIVEHISSAFVITVNRGYSAPGKMTPLVFELTAAEAAHLADVLT